MMGEFGPTAPKEEVFRAGIKKHITTKPYHETPHFEGLDKK